MEIGFGKPEDGIRLHVILGNDLRAIYFSSQEEIPSNIMESLHILQAEILEKIRQELSKMMISAQQSLDALNESFSDSVADEELLEICMDCEKLSVKLASKLEKINAL